MKVAVVVLCCLTGTLVAAEPPPMYSDDPPPMYSTEVAPIAKVEPRLPSVIVHQPVQLPSPPRLSTYYQPYYFPQPQFQSCPGGNCRVR